TNYAGLPLLISIPRPCMANRFKIGAAEFAFSPEIVVSYEEGGMSFRLVAEPVAIDAKLHHPAFDADSVNSSQPGRIAPGFWAPPFHFYDNYEAPYLSLRYPKQPPGTNDFRLLVQGS